MNAGFGVGQAVLCGLQPAADVAQRGTQLVGDIADHHLPLFLQARAVCRHVVEGCGQTPDLVVIGDQYGRRFLTVPHPLGGPRERSQRTYEPGAYQHRSADGEGEDERGNACDPSSVRR